MNVVQVALDQRSVMELEYLKEHGTADLKQRFVQNLEKINNKALILKVVIFLFGFGICVLLWLILPPLEKFTKLNSFLRIADLYLNALIRGAGIGTLCVSLVNFLMRKINFNMNKKIVHCIRSHTQEAVSEKA